MVRCNSKRQDRGPTNRRISVCLLVRRPWELVHSVSAERVEELDIRSAFQPELGQRVSAERAAELDVRLGLQPELGPGISPERVAELDVRSAPQPQLGQRVSAHSTCSSPTIKTITPQHHIPPTTHQNNLIYHTPQTTYHIPRTTRAI